MTTTMQWDAARYASEATFVPQLAASLVDLLGAIRAYGDTRSEYNTTAHDYWVSVFALSRAVGRDFL